MVHIFTGNLSFDQNAVGPRNDSMALLQTLTEADELWVLGTAPLSIPGVFYPTTLPRIKARLHLICGEHDHDALIHSGLWASVDRMKEIVLDGQLMVLSYFPLMTWRGAEEDTGPTQGSLHLFGYGGAAHLGWWRAVNTSLDAWQGRCATFAMVRQRSKTAFFATPFLEAVYPERRRIVRCDICYEPMDRAVPGRCYRWRNGTIVTFFDQAVLSRIAEFRDWNLPPFTDEKSIFCADCLYGALRYSDIKEGTRYVFAPGMDLQAVRAGRISGSSPRLFST